MTHFTHTFIHTHPFHERSRELSSPYIHTYIRMCMPIYTHRPHIPLHTHNTTHTNTPHIYTHNTTHTTHTTPHIHTQTTHTFIHTQHHTYLYTHTTPHLYTHTTPHIPHRPPHFMSAAESFSSPLRSVGQFESTWARYFSNSSSSFWKCCRLACCFLNPNSYRYKVIYHERKRNEKGTLDFGLWNVLWNVRV
jgi:hypothetical protein